MSRRLFDDEKLEVYRASLAFIAWLEPILQRGSLPVFDISRGSTQERAAALDVWVAKSRSFVFTGHRRSVAVVILP